MNTPPRFRHVVILVVGLQLVALSGAILPSKTAGSNNSPNASNKQSLALVASNPEILNVTGIDSAYKPPDNGGPGTSIGSGTRYRL